MFVSHLFHKWLLLSLVERLSSISFHRPNFCPNSQWQSTATTFADINIVGTHPWGIFITKDNTVYTLNTDSSYVGVWPSGSTSPARYISGNLQYPYSLFVSDSNDVYIDNGYSNLQVDRRSPNSTNSTAAMFVCEACYGLFIDINDNIYCSMYNAHKVVSRSLKSRLNVFNVVAGTGSSGYTATTLYGPNGIFVDTNLDLYVADYGNSRIQKFATGQLSATTINTGPIVLNGPIGVLLDANGYLYIADDYNHRIIGSDQNGFRCIAACNGLTTSASNALYFPTGISFDSYGNLYAVDWGNSRVQKFTLLTSLCSNSTDSTSIINTTNTTVYPEIAISYNRPTFDPLATWISDGITLTNNITVGARPNGLFIDRNDIVYIANRANSVIQIWSTTNNSLIKNITTSLINPYSLFVTMNGDIYTDNGASNSRVDKWTTNGTGYITVMSVKAACYGLFIDIQNSLYCSMYDNNLVAMTSLNQNSSIWTIATGTECILPTSNALINPCGIFVDTNLNLYVADKGNNRIQKFSSSQLIGITVAGSGATNTITLNGPTGVILDSNGDLFIVDSGNHRIVGSGPNGFRCIIACSGTSGSSSNQLNSPVSMSFDSYGNIFVVDRNNSRIQKFMLNSSTTVQPQTTNQTTIVSTTSVTTTTNINNTTSIGIANITTNVVTTTFSSTTTVTTTTTTRTSTTTITTTTTSTTLLTTTTIVTTSTTTESSITETTTAIGSMKNYNFAVLFLMPTIIFIYIHYIKDMAT